MPSERVPVLHAVTNDEILSRPDFLERARRVMHAGGVRVAVHVRAPHLHGRMLHEIATRVAQLQEETGSWVIVNDRADVALTSGARGVQLTSRSMSPADASELSPNLWIGASVHTQRDAQLAVAGGARWLVAGHVFETESHPGEPGRGVPFIERLVAEQTLPIIAIGGIRPEHVSRLREAGAYGVAVIRGVWNSTDAGASVIDYLSAHGAAGGR